MNAPDVSPGLPAIVEGLRNALSDAPLREEAVQFLRDAGLPGNKHEEYRFTPISRAIEKILPHGRAARITRPPEDDLYIPGYIANYLVFVNGFLDLSLSRIISPADQLQISSLTETPMEPSVSAHFGKHVDYRTDAFAALNTAFWQDGALVRVPAGKTVDAPLVIVHFDDARERPHVSANRLVLIAGQESRIRLVQTHVNRGTQAVFNSWVEEIVVGEKAKFDYVKVQATAGETHQVATTTIHQSNDSIVNTYTVTLGGKMLRNNFSIAVDGERCESHFYGLYMPQKDCLIDNHTVVDHRKPNSYSNELYKGILAGNARGVFNGKIFVRPHAQKTNAFQANRNVLLDDTAVIHTKPQLEIWADDVKCSHGCTSGQLDEEALFYLQSRGISKDSARGLLLSAFAGEILETLGDAVLKSHLEKLIADKLPVGASA